MTFESLSLIEIAFLFGTGLLGGLIEASAGGSGLVTLPVLMLFGVPPVQAMATSKFQYAFGALASITRFARAGLIQGRVLLPLLVAAALAGGAGAFVLTQASPELIATVVPFALIAVAIYFAINPHFSDHARPQRISLHMAAVLVVLPIGFYDGFLGTGSASFYLAAFMGLLGLGARQATATTKLVDFMSGSAALLVLAVSGNVLLLPGLLLATGQVIGAWVGAGMVVKYGAKWIRPAVVVVTIALSLDLLRRHLPTLAALFNA